MGVKYSLEEISYDASFPTLSKRPCLLSSLFKLPILSSLPSLSADEPVSTHKKRSNDKECPHPPSTKSISLSASDFSTSSSVPTDGVSLLLCPPGETPPLGAPSHCVLLLLSFQPSEELHFCKLSFKLQVALCLEGKSFSRALGISSMTLLLNHFLAIKEENLFCYPLM